MCYLLTTKFKYINILFVIFKVAIMKYISYKYSGFFLIELLVAIGIFSILTLWVAQIHWKSVEIAYNTKKYIDALNIASSVLEEMQLLNLQPETKRNDFLVSIKSIPFPLPQLPLTNQKIKKFQLNYVTVSYKSISGNNEKISLCSGSII